jgi:hypothetical protein
MRPPGPRVVDQLSVDANLFLRREHVHHGLPLLKRRERDQARDADILHCSTNHSPPWAPRKVH